MRNKEVSFFLGNQGNSISRRSKVPEKQKSYPLLVHSSIKSFALCIRCIFCASCGFLVLLLIHFLNVFARIIAIPFYDVCNFAIKTTMIYCHFQSSESLMHNYISSSYLVLSYLYLNVSFHLFSCPEEPEDPFPEVRE